MQFLRRFWVSEDGASTIEFVLVFPLIFLVFLSTVELGLLMTRQIMLDRGLDLAVRQVRLGAVNPVTHDALKRLICRGALIIPDCMNQLKLEMRPADPRAWTTLPASIDCVNRANPAEPVRGFTPGQSNELMMLRACSLFDPLFPTSGLGAQLHRQSGNASALVSSTTFVIEPS
ncbi:MAG TPA: TadE/TadG family type IV pilus assembly protein [Rubellimicrobium sp.]|nr:TadE/TadG family type IV pilus assembly protein [Rubellimicrobium sp.]